MITAENIVLAMEKGELQGLCQTLAGLRSTRPGWIEQGKFKILFTMEHDPVPGLDAPTIYDFTKTDEQRAIIASMIRASNSGARSSRLPACRRSA